MVIRKRLKDTKELQALSLPTQDRQYIPAWSAAEKPNPLCWLKESWVMESPNRKNCSYIAGCRCQMYSMQFDALPATHHVDWLPDVVDVWASSEVSQDRL